MKRTLFLLGCAAMIMSCGSSKKAMEAQNQLLLEALQQQNVEKTRGAVLRTMDPCEELALDPSAENIRAFGTATSYIEKTARNEAARDARNQLAQMMKVAVDGAAQDYSQNATQNRNKTAQEIGEVVMTQYVSEVIENTKPIKWTVYDLADGSIRVNVCLEMGKSTEMVKDELNNVLDKNGVIGIQYDRDRFIDKVSSGLEDYKKQQREKK